MSAVALDSSVKPVASTWQFLRAAFGYRETRQEQSGMDATAFFGTEFDVFCPTQDFRGLTGTYARAVTARPWYPAGGRNV